MSERPEAQIFASSVKIEQTAKGAAMVTVHVYDNDDNKARARATELYKQTIADLKKEGLPVAAEAGAK